LICAAASAMIPIKNAIMTSVFVVLYINENYGTKIGLLN